MDTGTAVMIAAVIAVIGYAVKGAVDIQMREREQKEERYKSMLISIKGFYASSQNQKLKEKFIEEMTMAYLYASDRVIQTANKFLDTVKMKAEPSSDEDKRKALAILIIAMRKDLKKTKLLESEFQTWIPT
jgi:hypothetical protein